MVSVDMLYWYVNQPRQNPCNYAITKIGHFWQLNCAQIQRIAIHLWKVVKESPRESTCIFRYELYKLQYICILYGRFSVLFTPSPENLSLCPLKLNELEELNNFFKGTSHEWLCVYVWMGGFCGKCLSSAQNQVKEHFCSLKKKKKKSG